MKHGRIMFVDKHLWDENNYSGVMVNYRSNPDDQKLHIFTPSELRDELEAAYEAGAEPSRSFKAWYNQHLKERG